MLVALGEQMTPIVFHGGESFTAPTFLAPPVEPVQPIAMVSRNKLQLLAAGVNQDILVNKLMMYKNASLAETVSHLNQWDHCSIPIHALEVGLRHRQLDTVAFFLERQRNRISHW
ncbi:hypothetical protein BSL78_27916 [Apostichopus japonicus]|uniref:Uncharacterized protein n=1 Tax=Stichopus japonicus TaxID=307972 RepID=A0A2G8JHR6_STIJA|nr:hypothetical protein BSL78_27916 [Apostichopus japonicus]